MKTLALIKLLFVFFSGFAYFISNGINKLKSESSKSFVSFPKKTDTYTNIFSVKDSNFLKQELTFFSKGTTPVARFEDTRDSTTVIVLNLILNRHQM